MEERKEKEEEEEVKEKKLYAPTLPLVVHMDQVDTVLGKESTCLERLHTQPPQLPNTAA